MNTTTNDQKGSGAAAPASLSRHVTSCHVPRRGAVRKTRLLKALLHAGKPVSTVELRTSVGASNISDLVIRVRSLHGINIDTLMIDTRDRDGKSIRLGHYSIRPGSAECKGRALLAALEGKASG